MNQEKMWRYALMGAQAELSEVEQKLAAVNTLGDGDAGVSKGERERMARALENAVRLIKEDIHELCGR